MGKVTQFIISVGGTLLLGSLPSVFTFGSIDTWYEGLAKPVFTPPNWLFGSAWTILFILMGTAHYLVWSRHGIKATWSFYPQMVLNMLWTFLFFGLQAPFPALLEILLLIFAISIMLLSFGRKEKSTRWLLAPYLLWVLFATALNTSIWLLNR